MKSATPKLSLHSKPKRRKRLLVTGAIAVFIIAAGITSVIIYKNANKIPTVASIVADKPILIGGNRVVNACRALPADKVKAVFKLDLATQYTFTQNYAEGNQTKANYIMSQCEFEIGPQKVNDPYDDVPNYQANIGLQLATYDSTETPAKAAESNKKNTFYQARTVGADTFYIDPDNQKVLFSYKNHTIELSIGVQKTDLFNGKPIVSSVDDSVDGIAKYFTAALPILKHNIDDQTLPQTPVEPYDKGKEVAGAGSSIIINPCDVFSGLDFLAITGSKEDNTSIRLQQELDTAGAAKLVNNSKSSLATAICHREGFVNATPPGSGGDSGLDDSLDDVFGAYNKSTFPVVDEQISLDKSAAVTLDKTKKFIEEQRTSEKAKAANNTLEIIQNLGDYAAFQNNRTFNGTDDYRIIVASGAYQFQIRIFYDHPYGTSLSEGQKQGAKDQFIKAAQLLIAKLPKS